MFSDQQLLGSDFDPTAYLRHTLQLPSFENEQQRLTRCIESVDQELQAAIAENAGDLVENVAQLNAAGTTAEAVQGAVLGAQSSLARLRHVIRDPFVQVEAGVAELRNSSAALEMMRAVYRFLSLVNKLQECGGDPARSARLLREIEEILAEHDISGIEAVDAAMPLVSRTSAAVRSKALDALRSAMAKRNLGELGLAVQCFASLGTLGKVVVDTVAERKREALTVIVKQISATVLQGDGEAALAKIDGALQTIAEHATSLAELWKALRRRDAATQRTFLDFVAASTSGDPKTLLADFWVAVSKHLSDHLQSVTKKGALHAMAITEYTRFHRILSTFSVSMREFFAAIVGESRDSPAVASFSRGKTEPWLRSTVGDIEERFKQSMRDRHREKLASLTTRVQAAMPTGGADRDTIDIAADPKTGGGIPSAANTFDAAARGLVKALHHDLATNRPDDYTLGLTLEIAGRTLSAAAKAMRDAAAKVPIGDLPSVAVSVTAGQLFQISLCNAAALLATEVQSAVAMLPRNPTADTAGTSADTQPTRAAVAELEALSESIVAPFFDSAAVAITRHIDDLFPADGVLTAAPGAARPVAAGAAKPGANPNASARSTQLHTRVWHFLTRFALLFDRQAPGLEQAQRNLSSAITRHFLVNTLICQVADATARRAVAADLEGLVSLLSSLFPVDRLGRTGRALRHVIRTANAATAEDVPSAKEVRSMAQRGHAAVLLLGLLLRLDSKQIAVEITTAARLSKDELRKVLSEALQTETLKGCARLWEGVTKSCLAEVDANETQQQVPATTAASLPTPGASPTAAAGPTDNETGTAALTSDAPAADTPAPPPVRVPTVAARVKQACLALEEDLVPR
jgi:hypothetical protein